MLLLFTDKHKTNFLIFQFCMTEFEKREKKQGIFVLKRPEIRNTHPS